MAFRFRKSIQLFPGFRVNLSGGGASVSVGPRGLRYTIGPKGTRITAGIPGTGLSWTEYAPHPKRLPENVSPVLDSFDGLRDPASLPAIRSAPVDQINELSTSELAPILNSAHRRRRYAPAAMIVSVLTWILALISKNQLLVSIAALHTTIFVPFAIFLDRYRRSVRIHYRLDEPATQVTEALANSFADLKSSTYVWCIRAKGGTYDWKRNAGANQLVERQRIYPTFKRPASIRANVSFPCITIGAEELYFLPDAMLIVTLVSVTALRYEEFSIELNQTHFIEDEKVPGDASIVGHTWRYVNKNGGPDRRFNFNRQIPICLYGQLAFESPSGLRGLVQFSSPSAGDRFVRVTEVLRGIDAALFQSKSIKSFKQATRGPTLLFWSFFLLSTVTTGSLSFLDIYNAVQAQSVATLEPLPAAGRTSSEAAHDAKPKLLDQAVRKEAALPPPIVITPPLGTSVRGTAVVPMPRPRPKTTN